MKKFKVFTLKSDKLYTVTAIYDNGEKVTVSFYGEKDAKAHAQWVTNHSPRKETVRSVEVNHVIRYVEAI